MNAATFVLTCLDDRSYLYLSSTGIACGRKKSTCQSQAEDLTDLRFPYPYLNLKVALNYVAAKMSSCQIFLSHLSGLPEFFPPDPQSQCICLMTHVRDDTHAAPTVESFTSRFLQAEVKTHKLKDVLQFACNPNEERCHHFKDPDYCFFVFKFNKLTTGFPNKYNVMFL